MRSIITPPVDILMTDSSEPVVHCVPNEMMVHCQLYFIVWISSLRS